MSGLNLANLYRADMGRAQQALDVGDPDFALAILDRFKGIISADAAFALLYAQILNAKGELADAEKILVRALELAPSNANAVALRASCLAGMDRRAEALRTLDEARQAFPKDNLILGSYLAHLLTEQGPAAAIAALRQEHQRRTAPRHLDTAIEKLRQKALSLHDPAELRRLDPEDLLELEGGRPGEGYSLRIIYETFEPMGCNCELGLVQSRGGAEPLSLLRWTFVTPEKLIEMLACDLEGYETPGHYSFGRDLRREFILEESLFGTSSHTGVYHGDIPEDEFLDRLIRRQGFLKRKFLADTAQGRKIFTYKADAPLTDAQMAGIEGELRRLGVRHCLFVMPTRDAEQAGTVTIASPSRAVGYLSSVMPVIRYEQWNRIAIATYDQFIRNPGAS